MKKLALLCLLALVPGCGKSDRQGKEGQEAMIQGRTTSDWIKQLGSTEETDRKEAVRILKQRGETDRTIIEQLEEAVKEKNNNKELRMGAAEVLGQLGWNADLAKDTLIKTLPDKDVDVARAAAKALWDIDPATAKKHGVVGPPRKEWNPND